MLDEMYACSPIKAKLWIGCGIEFKNGSVPLLLIGVRHSLGYLSKLVSLSPTDGIMEPGTPSPVAMPPLATVAVGEGNANPEDAYSSNPEDARRRLAGVTTGTTAVGAGGAGVQHERFNFEMSFHSVNLTHLLPAVSGVGIKTNKQLTKMSFEDFDRAGISDLEDRKKLFYLISRIKNMGVPITDILSPTKGGGADEVSGELRAPLFLCVNFNPPPFILHAASSNGGCSWYSAVPDPSLPFIPSFSPLPRKGPERPYFTSFVGGVGNLVTAEGNRRWAAKWRSSWELHHVNWRRCDGQEALFHRTSNAFQKPHYIQSASAGRNR
jgi:hypothetical protein